MEAHANGAQFFRLPAVLRTFQSKRKVLGTWHRFQHERGATLHAGRQGVHFFRQVFRQVMILMARLSRETSTCALFCTICLLESATDARGLANDGRLAQRGARLDIPAGRAPSQNGSLPVSGSAECDIGARWRRSRQREIREGSRWTTNRNVGSAASASMQRRAKLSPWPRTKSRRHKRRRTFAPTFVHGATLGISRKTPERPGRAANS